MKYTSIEGIIQQSKYDFDEDYLDNFVKAYLTFRFMWVYCPIEKKIINLNPMREDFTCNDLVDNYYL